MPLGESVGTAKAGTASHAERRYVRALYWLFLTHQWCVPLLAYYHTVHAFQGVQRGLAMFAGLVPALLLAGATPVWTSMPGHGVRASWVVLLVPLEIILQAVWFGGGWQGYVVEAFSVALFGAAFALPLMAWRDGSLDRRAAMGYLLILALALAAFARPLLAFYTGAGALQWMALGATWVTSVWGFQQLIAEEGPFTVHVQPGTLSAWIQRRWPDRFDRVTAAPERLDTLVSGPVIATLALWFVVPFQP